MKKTTLTLFVFLFSFLVVLGQYDFYWSANKKHYLYKQSDAFIVKLNKDLNIKTIIENLQNDIKIREIVLVKRDLALVSFKDSLMKLSDLKDYKEFLNAMPVYHLGKLPILLTGQILLKPRKDIPIEDVLKITNNRLHILTKTKCNTYVTETDDWDKLLEYSNLIYKSGLVEYCHPNFIAHREKHQINDPKYSEQYYLNNTGQFGGTSGIDINAPEAWSITTGSCPIVVAVIDDGVENHEDINDRVFQGFTPQFSQNNPDTHGAPNDNDPPNSPIGHGQACAGIIGATHNSLGIRGIAPEIDIVPINIFNDWFVFLGEVYYAEDAQDLANAIDFAWDDAGADILSNSWGYSTLILS